MCFSSGPAARLSSNQLSLQDRNAPTLQLLLLSQTCPSVLWLYGKFDHDSACGLALGKSEG